MRSPSKLFPHGQVTHYNETTLKNLYIFHLGRSLITIRLFLKKNCIFHLDRSLIQWDHFWNLYFSPKQVTHYNRTTLKTLLILCLSRSPITMRPLWKIFLFFYLGNSFITMRLPWKLFIFPWASNPWQFDHFKKSFNFTNRQVVWYNYTISKDPLVFFSECTF